MLGGDFNLPGIDWDDLSPKHGAQDVNHIDQLLDLSHYHNLHQVVRDPTRLENTLDLLFTTHPGLVGRSTTGPGISDHDHLVITDTDLKATMNAKKPRNIQMFTKAKWDNIRSDIETFEESFFTSIPSNNTIDVNWESFKTVVLDSIDKWVASKQTRQNNDLPWMTREAKHIKRQKQRAHSKARRTKSERDWARFRHLRKTLRQLMKRSYMDYINNLVDPVKDGGNKEPMEVP